MGNEVFARFLHRTSSRASKPFVPVNCAALTATLAETQLFGHETAFGAGGSTLGAFRAADQGIAFLHEIGEMPPELQPALLRLRQQHDITAVGAAQAMHVDLEVIAATSRNLEAEVAVGRFREDLFCRLNMVKLHIPPLPDGREDFSDLIELLSVAFADRNQRSHWRSEFDTLSAFCKSAEPDNWSDCSAN